jgi:hypothetical protein
MNTTPTARERTMKRIYELSPRTQVILIIFLVLVTRLSLAWVFGSEVADLSLVHDMADVISRGDNIYQVPTELFPYTPLPMFLPYWTYMVSQFLGMPFHFVFKWLMVAADVGIAVVLWWQARKRGLDKVAFLLGVGYALNPVSILITSFHGNIIVGSAFFSLFAYCLVAVDSDLQNYRLSGLSLGIAIGLRGFPILYLPFFLRKLNIDWRRKLIFVFLAIAPSLLTLLPFVIADFPSVWRQFFSYSGYTDYGWIALGRSYWFIVSGSRFLPGTVGQSLLAGSKWLFVLMYVLFVGLFWWKSKSFRLLEGLLGTTLLFFAVYGGISSQYLIWAVPFALCIGTLWEKAYTWSAAFALVSFYLFYFPGILFGDLPIDWPDMNPTMMYFVLISNFIFWALCAAWTVRIVSSAIFHKGDSSLSAGNPLRLDEEKVT